MKNSGLFKFAGIALLICFLFVLRAAAMREHTRKQEAPQIALKTPGNQQPFLASDKLPSAPVPRFQAGYNFALMQHGGKARGGLRSELLIDGNSVDYDGANGYAHTNWRNNPAESFVIELAETFDIDCVRFLLWDLEEARFYRYKLEVSSEIQPQKWTVVADKTGATEECRSWQVVRFEKQPVKLLRLTGTYNSVNSGFHVVEFQACVAPANGFPNDLPHAPSLPNAAREDLEF